MLAPADVASRGLADRLGATVQASLLRSPGDVDKLISAGVHIRRVTGAYLERAGALAHGEPTDVAYLRLAHQLAAAGARTWRVGARGRAAPPAAIRALNRKVLVRAEPER